MATFTLETATRNAACNAIVDLIDGSTGGDSVLDIRNSSNAVLAKIPLGNAATPAFENAGTQTPGVANLISTPVDDASPGNGTTDNFVMTNRDGTTVVFSGDAGSTGATLTVSDTISDTDVVSLTSFSVTVPATTTV